MEMLSRDITGLVSIDSKIRKRASGLLPAVSRGAAGRELKDAADPLDRLTGREREILQLTIDGLSSNEIGERLSISRRTAEAHRSHIMNKLGVHSLSQLIRFTVSCVSFPNPD